MQFKQQHFNEKAFFSINDSTIAYITRPPALIRETIEEVNELFNPVKAEAGTNGKEENKEEDNNPNT